MILAFFAITLSLLLFGLLGLAGRHLWFRLQCRIATLSEKLKVLSAEPPRLQTQIAALLEKTEAMASEQERLRSRVTEDFERVNAIGAELPRLQSLVAALSEKFDALSVEPPRLGARIAALLEKGEATASEILRLRTELEGEMATQGHNLKVLAEEILDGLEILLECIQSPGEEKKAFGVGCRGFKKSLVDLKAEYVSGPKKPDLAEDEVIVLCLVRNGEIYLEEFIRHYFSIGAKHLVFLDNGSTDRTVNLAGGFAGVTVYRTDFPFRNDGDLRMRDWLLERFAKNRWSLTVDIDEFFDYPCSDRVSLRDLVRYLNSNRYTAVVTHLLELFPAAIYKYGEKTFVRNEYKYYTPFAESLPYHFEGRPFAENEIKFRSGGKRKQVFGNDIFLSKHALLFSDAETELGRAGCLLSTGRPADFSGVLLHYLLTNRFFDQTEYAVRSECHRDRSGEYKRYQSILATTDVLKLKGEDSREFRSTQGLIECGYLDASEKFRAFATACEGKREESKGIECGTMKTH